MERQTGRYRITSTLGEQARAPPPTRKAIELLNSLGVLREITGTVAAEPTSTTSTWKS